MLMMKVPQGNAGADAAGADDVDEVAQRRAKAAAEKNQQIAHRSLSRTVAANKSAASGCAARLAMPARIVYGSANEKGGSSALPPI